MRAALFYLHFCWHLLQLPQQGERRSLQQRGQRMASPGTGLPHWGQSFLSITFTSQSDEGMGDETAD